MEWHKGELTITTDRSQVDVDAVHSFLRDSYWAKGIPRERVVRSIEGSIPFSLFRGKAQVGFARVITDRATFAYLADVYVLPEVRGQGLALWLMEAILAHPDVQDVRRWHLLTRDAHGLYAKAGFVPVANPERHMERVRINPYGAEPGEGSRP